MAENASQQQKFVIEQMAAGATLFSRLIYGDLRRNGIHVTNVGEKTFWALFSAGLIVHIPGSSHEYQLTEKGVALAGQPAPDTAPQGDDDTAGDNGIRATLRTDYSRFDRMSIEQMYEELVTSHHAQRGDFPIIFSALVARHGNNRAAVAREFSRLVGPMRDCETGADGDDGAAGDDGIETPANAPSSPIDAIWGAAAMELAQDAQTFIRGASYPVEAFGYGDKVMQRYSGKWYSYFVLGVNERGFCEVVDNLNGRRGIIEGTAVYLRHRNSVARCYEPHVKAWEDDEPKRKYRSFEDGRYTREWEDWRGQSAEWNTFPRWQRVNAAIFAPREQGRF